MHSLDADVITNHTRPLLMTVNEPLMASDNIGSLRSVLDGDGIDGVEIAGFLAPAPGKYSLWLALALQASAPSFVPAMQTA